MPRSSRQTRQRILDAAYGLFYRRGFARVGVDEIAAAARLTKRTLYYHFDSKDDLLGRVLESQSELAFARIRKHEARYAGDPAAVVEMLFNELARWSMTPRWSGSGFTRLVVELADLPGHPARQVARRHKRQLEDWITALLARENVPCAADRAGEVVLLLEGATVLMLIHGDRAYAASALAAAKRLLARPEP